MLWLYLYPRSCPVAERFTLTNSRRTRRFPEGPFSHDIYFRLLWDDLSIHFFLKKGKERKKKWEAEKQSRWINFSAAHTTLCYFLLCHPSWLSLCPELGHGHSTGLHREKGRDLVLILGPASQDPQWQKWANQCRIIMPTPKVPIPHSTIQNIPQIYNFYKSCSS